MNLNGFSGNRIWTPIIRTSLTYGNNEYTGRITLSLVLWRKQNQPLIELDYLLILAQESRNVAGVEKRRPTMCPGVAIHESETTCINSSEWICEQLTSIYEFGNAATWKFYSILIFQPFDQHKSRRKIRAADQRQDSVSILLGWALLIIDRFGQGNVQ